MSREFSTVEPGTIARSSLRATVSAAERRHQFADERILSIVREGESGQRVADLCEAHGISAQMYYLWKTRYGGMELTDLQQLRRRALTVRTGASVAAAVAIFLGGFLIGRSLSSGPAAASPSVAAAAEEPAQAPPASAAIAAPSLALVIEAPRSETAATTSTGVTTGEEGPPVSSTAPTELPRGPESAATAALPEAPQLDEPKAPPRAIADTAYAVQVAAVPDVREADALLLRLTAKGYPTYVLSKAGPSALHRVRIGPFKTREEAQEAATRLAMEEQFTPWITK